MKFSVNLNEYVRVKITPYGHEKHREAHEHLMRAYLSKFPYRPLEVDKDGYTRMQLWCFIQDFGPHIGLGTRPVIEGMDIVFGGEAR